MSNVMRLVFRVREQMYVMTRKEGVLRLSAIGADDEAKYDALCKSSEDFRYIYLEPLPTDEALTSLINRQRDGDEEERLFLAKHGSVL